MKTLFAVVVLPFLLNNHEEARKHLPSIVAGGVAMIDYDNDGHLDLYFTNGADLETLKKASPADHNRLFRNDGKGHFEDVTEKAGVAGTGFDIGVAVGDFNKDGCPDLFVSGVYHHTLYRNNCNGTFTDVTAKAGLTKAAFAVGASWLDYDNDGQLDLFVVNYVQWEPAKERECRVNNVIDFCHPRFYQPVANTLYRSNGNGTFTDVSQRTGIATHKGKGMAAAVSGGDIFVTNDRVFNFFFKHQPNGIFKESAFDAGVAVPQSGDPPSSMGTDFRDFDNDGLPDILFTALKQETFPLFRNLGAKGFEEITFSSNFAKLTRVMSGWSAHIADFDNDGNKDIFVTRSDALSPRGGHGEQAKEHNSLFRNLGKNKFELTPNTGFGDVPAQMYRGAAVGDLDGDGMLDIAVTSLSGNAEVWFNRMPKANWIDVRLNGMPGANVKLTAQGKAQFNHSGTSIGYASSSDAPLHFGVGAASLVDEIEVTWRSGKKSVLHKVPINRTVTIKE